MTLSGPSPEAVFRNISETGDYQSQIGINVLKKANEQTKEQGEAKIELIEEVSPVSESGHLDAYA